MTVKINRRNFCAGAAAFAAVASVPAVPGVCIAAPSALQCLNNFVKNVAAASGSFTQSVKDKNGKSVDGDSTGTFVFSRPGKFRWETVKPWAQSIVSDGKTIWLWDPDLNQVTVKNVVAETAGTNAAAVLFGEGDIDAAFRLTDVSESGKPRVEAVPRKEDPTFAKIFIGFDGAGELASLDLIDHFGQTTHLEFSGMKKEKSLPSSRFEFVIPKGADVLGDGSQGIF